MMIGHVVAALAQLAADLVAVGAARPERDVEQHDVEVLGARPVDRRAPVGDRQHAVALALEGLAQRLAQRRIVVADEDVEVLGGHPGDYRIPPGTAQRPARTSPRRALRVAGRPARAASARVSRAAGAGSAGRPRARGDGLGTSLRRARGPASDQQLGADEGAPRPQVAAVRAGRAG